MALNLFGKKKSAKPIKDEQSSEAVVVQEKASVPTTSNAPVITGPSVLRRMHVSEKSARGHAMGQYTFVVDSSARKPEIAKAVAARYNVKVASVKIVNLPSKSRRVGKYYGSKAGITKAVVILQKGQSIASV